MSRLRVGVVGAGPMGRLHAHTIARASRRDDRFELVAIADHHPGRAESVSRECGGRPLEEVEEMLDAVDALVVAVPTSAHFPLAAALLERGLDLLIEKPLAQTTAQGERLVQLARGRGCILQVGHSEWYNPAWREAASRVGEILHLEVQRLGPLADRGLDVDVVQDLMLHDLDWVSRSIGEEIVEVEARAPGAPGDRVDEAEARLVFRSGRTARIVASRVHPVSLRCARIEGREATVTADLLARSGTAARLASSPSGPGPPLDPLEAQWQDFVEAILARKEPVNGGTVGVAALRLVDRVRDAIERERARAGRDHGPRLGR